jgi:hypothetical protein
MQSTDLEEIKAALWEQASHPCTRVKWGTAQVMAARRHKGHLLVLLRGWGHWHAVESVTISRAELCPTGACDLEEGTEGTRNDGDARPQENSLQEASALWQDTSDERFLPLFCCRFTPPFSKNGTACWARGDGQEMRNQVHLIACFTVSFRSSRIEKVCGMPLLAQISLTEWVLSIPFRS